VTDNRSEYRLDHSAAVRPQIYRLLRDRIIRGDLEPGTKISESAIALEYLVSRQPVREAFIRLVEMGLLEVRPQRGTFVRRIVTSAVMDARFVREAIEADIIKAVLENQDNTALVAELQRQIIEQERVAESDPDAFMTLDDLFHHTLADAAGKSYAWAVVENIKMQMDRVRHISVRCFSRTHVVEQHRAIVEGIAAGDAVAAEQAMRIHLRGILKDLPGIVQSKADFFEDDQD